MVRCYIARLDIYNRLTKDTFGGLDHSGELFKMPSLAYCERIFKKQMKSRKLPKDQYFTIDVQVYEFDKSDGELGELIEIIDMKEYK